MKKVLVLMSTYNGEHFLKEQLDSVFAQQGVSIHLLVRDDGSRDQTVSILREYETSHRNMTILADSNVGCSASFFTLMQYAVDAVSEQYDYYAFCDQDDQWLPFKLKQAVEKLDEFNSTYKLYFSAANYVNKDLNFIKVKKIPLLNDYTSFMWRNPALGCTMVFNKSLLQVCSRGAVQHYQLHDAWMWRCALFLDATIIADEEPSINYRQHGNNVTNANKSLINRYIYAFKRRIKNIDSSRANCSVFYNLYKNEISDAKGLFLLAIINYKNSFKDTLHLLRLQKFKGCSALDKLFWRLVILFRLY